METQTDWAPVNLAGLHLEHPVMVGAGPIKTVEDVKEIADSNSAAIIVGSITLKERPENPGTTYHYDPESGLSLNSRGLPNQGFRYYEFALPEMARIAQAHNKPLIVSLAGFNPAESAKLARLVKEGGADGMQLDWGCGSVWDGQDQESIIGFYPTLAEQNLDAILSEVGLDIWLSIKAPIFSNPKELSRMARVLSSFKFIKAVTAANTFANAMLLDKEGQPVTTPGHGLAGLGGDPLRYINLGQVFQWRCNLPPEILVVGSGGVSQGRHARDYLQCGASAVEFVTAYFNKGPRAIDDILLS